MADQKTHPSGESGWRVINCQSCGREIKARASVDASEMACPYCSAPLAAEAAHQPAAPSGETATAPDPTGSAKAGERTKVRRRSRGGHTAVDEPDWERDRPDWDEAPDPDLEVDEYVEVDPNNPDAFRVRRVRRKRTLTASQKVTRNLAIAFVWLVGIGGVALLIIALYKGTDTANRDINTVAGLPADVRNLIAAERARGEIPIVLTQAESEAAEEIIRGYLSAEGWTNKLPFVYMPERAGPRMESWYARPENSDAAIPVGPVKLRDKITVQGRFVIKIAIETFPADYRIFALRQSSDDIKIDWETSEGYQEMPLAEFKEKRPTEPVPFRVKMQADNYYGGAFSNEEEYQSVAIYYPGDISFKIFGYLRRGNERVEALARRLAAEAPNVIVSLAYPPQGGSREQVEVIEEISPTWFD